MKISWCKYFTSVLQLCSGGYKKKFFIQKVLIASKFIDDASLFIHPSSTLCTVLYWPTSDTTLYRLHSLHLPQVETQLIERVIKNYKFMYELCRNTQKKKKKNHLFACRDHVWWLSKTDNEKKKIRQKPTHFYAHKET